MAFQRFSFVNEVWYCVIIEIGPQIMLVIFYIRGDNSDVTKPVIFLLYQTQYFACDELNFASAIGSGCDCDIFGGFDLLRLEVRKLPLNVCKRSAPRKALSVFENNRLVDFQFAPFYYLQQLAICLFSRPEQTCRIEHRGIAAEIERVRVNTQRYRSIGG